MSTLLDDGAVLYGRICDDPEDTTLRLAYADYLDDKGPATVKCPVCGGLSVGKDQLGLPAFRCNNCDSTGEVYDYPDRDRAELIRLQVEADRYYKPRMGFRVRHFIRVPDTGRLGRSSPWLTRVEADGLTRLHVIKKRERELLDGRPGLGRVECRDCYGGRNAPRDPVSYCAMCNGTGDLTRGSPVLLNCGFPWIVMCRRAELMTQSGGRWWWTPWALSVMKHSPTAGFWPTDFDPPRPSGGYISRYHWRDHYVDHRHPAANSLLNKDYEREEDAWIDLALYLGMRVREVLARSETAQQAPVE